MAAESMIGATTLVRGNVRGGGSLEILGKVEGDVIMTGTPSGVAATVAGDKIECEVEGVGKLAVTIGQPLK